jgi:hypothetical protein
MSESKKSYVEQDLSQKEPLQKYETTQVAPGSTGPKQEPILYDGQNTSPPVTK